MLWKVCGGGFVVIVTEAWWSREPLEASKVIVESPVGDVEEALMVNCNDDPGVTVRGDTGLVIVPVGKPEIVTETARLNPLEPVIEIVAGPLDPPWASSREFGETEIEKSGVGTGPGC